MKHLAQYAREGGTIVHWCTSWDHGDVVVFDAALADCTSCLELRGEAGKRCAPGRGHHIVAKPDATHCECGARRIER